MSWKQRFGAGLVLVAVALFGCRGLDEPRITAGVDGCSACGMIIDRPGQACGYIQDGRFVPFDSPACLLRQLEQERARSGRMPARIYFADYAEKGGLYPAEEMTFLLTSHLPTVMDSGVVAFHHRPDAEQARQHDDELLTDWTGYRRVRGRPDRTVEIVLGPDRMTPDVVSARKDDLLLWKLRGEGLERPLHLSIRGYDDAGAVTVPPTGETVEFRVLAHRPGAGFPVVVEGRPAPLGMLKVAGAHTSEEEAM